MLSIVTALELGALIGQPSATLVDNAELDTQVDDFACARDSLAKEDFKLSLAEWRRNFVLHNFHASEVANHLVTVLELTDAADVDAYRSIELKGIATSSGLGVAEEHTQFLAQLVNEDAGGVGLRDCCSKLTQCLRHESCLQSHLALTHFALDFGLRGKCGNRVDYHNVDCR